MFPSLTARIDKDLAHVCKDLDRLWKMLRESGHGGDFLLSGLIKNIEVSLREARKSLNSSSWLTVAGLLRALTEVCSVVMACRFGGHDFREFLEGGKITKYLEEVRRFDPGTIQVYDNLSEGYLHPYKHRTGMFLRPTLPKHTLVEFPRLDNYSAGRYLDILGRFAYVKKFVTVVIYKFDQTGEKVKDEIAADFLDNKNHEIELLIEQEFDRVRERMKPEVDFMIRNNL